MKNQCNACCGSGMHMEKKITGEDETTYIYDGNCPHCKGTGKI